MGKTKAAQRLTVVVCEPGQAPRLVTAEGDTLEMMQGYVGGLIEKLTSFTYMNPVVVDVYMNEEANIVDPPLPLNRVVRVRGVAFPIRGTVLLAAADQANGSTLSLDSIEGLSEFAMSLAKKFGILDPLAE
jgi:hypothetical protein